MEGTDKCDVDAEIVLQVSQEEYRPTKSEIKQDTGLSTVSATFPVPANNPTCCSYDYKFVQNIKCEHKITETYMKTVQSVKMGILLMIARYLVCKLSNVMSKYRNYMYNDLVFRSSTQMRSQCGRLI